MSTAIPAQRATTAPTEPDAIHHVSVLAELVVDHVLSGVAGTDAALHVDLPTASTDPATLMDTLARSDLSESARFGVLLAAFVTAAEQVA